MTPLTLMKSPPDVFLLGVVVDAHYGACARVRATNVSKRTQSHSLRIYVSAADVPLEACARVLAGSASVTIGAKKAVTTDVVLNPHVYCDWDGARARWVPRTTVIRIELEVDRDPVSYQAVLRLNPPDTPLQ
jgi:hypothetical protein